jgi:hypothetical protein
MRGSWLNVVKFQKKKKSRACVIGQKLTAEEARAY